MEIRATRVHVPISVQGGLTAVRATASAAALIPIVSGGYDAGLNTTFLSPPAVTGTTRSILTFGATANNSADDDGPAIRNAIAASAAGDEVYIPNGTYHIKGTTPINMKNGVSVRGESRAGAVLSTMLTAQPIGLLYAAPGVEDFTISNLSILLASGSSPLSGIRLGNASGTTLQLSRIAVVNVGIEGFQKHGVEINNARHIKVDGCLIRNATALDDGGSGYGVAISLPASNNNWVTNCTIGPVIRHALVIQFSSHHNLLDHNTIFNTVADSIDMHGEDEYSNEIAYNNVFDGIRNGTTISPNGSGIGVGEFSGVQGTTTAHDNSGPNHWVHHNTIDNMSNGIRVMNQSNFIWIEDNICTNCDGAGILADLASLQDTWITRNTCRFNANGVDLNDDLRATIRDNTITNNTGFGLRTNAGTINYLITGNIINSNGTNVSLGSSNGTYIP